MEEIGSLSPREGRQQEKLAGQLLFKRGGVRLLSNDGENFRFAVSDDKRREVIIGLYQRPLCSCEIHHRLGYCRHIAASENHLKQSGMYEEMKKTRAAFFGPKLFDAMENALPKSGTTRMEVTLFLDSSNDKEEAPLRIGIRIGEDRLYVVRSIPLFLEAIKDLTPLTFGKGFTFHPEWMHFTKAERRVLDILRGLCLARVEADAVRHGSKARTINLPDVFKRQILKALSQMSFRMVVDGTFYEVDKIKLAQLPIHYTVIGSERSLTLRAEFPDGVIPILADGSYVFCKGNLYSTPHYTQAVLPLLLHQRIDGRHCFLFRLLILSDSLPSCYPFFTCQAAFRSVMN